jgi:hypothetical protein
MTDAKNKKDAEKDKAVDPGAASPPKSVGLGIRLVPVDNSDQPVLANYTALNVAPGMVFIDFGFLEPAMLTALPRVAKQGGKLPESINGKLAVRVAMGYDGLQNLKQQIDRLMQAAAGARSQKTPQKG